MQSNRIEYGKFKHGSVNFWAEVNQTQAQRLNLPPWEDASPLGDRMEMDDLVVLPPVERGKLVTLGNPGNRKGESKFCRFQLKPATAVVPHRSMMALPYPEHPIAAIACLAFLVGRTGRRLKEATAHEVIFGSTLAIAFEDRETNQKQWGGCYDTFLSLGPRILTHGEKVWNRGFLEAYHNGDATGRWSLEKELCDINWILRDLTDVMTLIPSDWVIVELGDFASAIKPGHHVELKMEGGQSLANNVGMRASA